MITSDERETHILYDYPNNKVRIYTTQVDVYNNFIKRLGKKNIISNSVDDENSQYEIIVNEKIMRKPYLIAPLIKGKIK